MIDCPDPAALASFYEQLLGMQRIEEENDWVMIGKAPEQPGIAFQRVPALRAPQWPDPEHPQQMHIDLLVADLGEAERKALALGAHRLEDGGVEDGVERFRVYADPVGHPFCLVRE
ncbi:glyoxalase [Longimycelium tulufanense]|uniref:Glyoxalase n=1 Tax=Longimycelium tulufanense TaxID=907463 RepID=A0A8J3CJG3_9PSEU|nr:glyoxalase [Longimycelium tulufanense]